jgi:hypothetical protein
MLDMMGPSKAADAMMRAASLCLNDREVHYDAILNCLAAHTDRASALVILQLALPLGEEGRLDKARERESVVARARELLHATTRARHDSLH